MAMHTKDQPKRRQPNAAKEQSQTQNIGQLKIQICNPIDQMIQRFRERQEYIRVWKHTAEVFNPHIWTLLLRNDCTFSLSAMIAACSLLVCLSASSLTLSLAGNH